MTLRSSRVRMLAALSFEERCAAAFADYEPSSRDTTLSADFFSYDDRATPNPAANVAREGNWTKIQAIGKRAGWPVSRHPLNPYSMGDLERYVLAVAEHVEHLTVDLSCFTKLHLLAAARSLSKIDLNTDWSICYTTPFSYGNLDAPSSRGGWQDTLVLPLGDDPSLSRQGMALGVILAGMEADRIAIALSELEPASGLIILARNQDRPDLHRSTIANNSRLFAHLQGLQMPGPLGKKVLPYFRSGGWEIENVHMDNVVSEVARCLQRIVAAAASIEAPVVLFPFGPKIVVFLAGLYLARHYPAASWAVYPVPKTHPLDYSDGVRNTDWYSNRTILNTLDQFANRVRHTEKAGRSA
jgi:hypothetical protein